MARPRKSGRRTKSGQFSRSKAAMLERGEGLRNPPPDHITELRKLFSFVTPTKGPDGRVGEIDQDVCDAIGQFHALGLLDGHGHDPQELRDKGREWRNLYVKWLRGAGYKSGGYERMDGCSPQDTYFADALSDRERDRFNRMDRDLKGAERSALLQLLVDPEVGSYPDGRRFVGWAEGFIAEALLERGLVVKFSVFPDCNDRAWFDAAIRGLVTVVDGGLPSRWEKAA